MRTRRHSYTPEWSAAELKTLWRLADSGMGVSEIAAQLPGRTRNAIYMRLNRYGVSLRRLRLQQHGDANLQSGDAKSAAPRHNLPWTKEEEQRLLALATHRLSCAEIGAKLNRTAVSVEVRLKALSRGVVGAKKKEGRRRPCLRCTRPFNSAGPHNRLCRECRQDTGTVFTTPVAVVR